MRTRTKAHLSTQFTAFSLTTLVMLITSLATTPTGASSLSEISPRAIAHPGSTQIPIQGASSVDVLDEIARIESEQGAYSADLSEHLVSLGSSYQENGDHEAAVEAFKRAIHVERIHGGLYNLNQIAVLERMIESHVAVGDWKAASDRYEHFYWLHQRNYGDGDPRMLPVIEKLSHWHLNAYSLDSSSVSNHLVSAHNLYRMAVNIIDENYGSHDIRMINPLKGLAVSNYYLATLSQEQNRMAPISTSAQAEAEKKARLDQYILNAYYNGKAALTRMVEIYDQQEDAPIEEKIKARVQLGDWFMMFDRPHSAFAEYKTAYSNITEHKLSSPFSQSLFKEPRALPDMPVVKTQMPDNNEPHEYVLVQFDVSARGQARRVEILEAHPQKNVGLKTRVRKSLRSTRFRPQLIEGEAVETKHIVHRYIYPVKKS
ncbi:tetratricopeptide repeat protein [Marinibactrum halimedae]|uniref:Tetratricopeptide repeat protein n=1 Tax=Marinibactrum halimedae TaxID=1444977 RepID=A0AA37TA99_9GAMM|nr:tetratricopeptide repeat protein [Marinibactrum halimedae]MCD9458051.1 tetratricopeptide repeat protein [Marinibactrum halimedae]GLS27677.1 hypothetical protein GCM10007877_33960 [Marinibactrum halimedae]